MKNILFLFLILFSVSSCWAPRCPMKTCRVKQEHFHEDQVSGVFMGRGLYPPRIHYLWDKDKGESNPDTEFQPSGGGKRKNFVKIPMGKMVEPGTGQSIFRYFTYILAGLVIVFGLVMVSQTIPYLSFEFAVDFLGTKSDKVLYQWDFNLFFYTHICSSLVVLLAGISQFMPGLAARKPELHRILGKIYVLLILFVAAPSGLGLSLYANGGLPAKVGFFMQSSVWFLVTLKAFSEIRKHKIENHITWMLRSYAITLAAMSLRTESYLMKYLFGTKPFETYLTVVWVSWTGNLLLCELLITFGFSKFLVHSLKNKTSL